MNSVYQRLHPQFSDVTQVSWSDRQAYQSVLREFMKALNSLAWKAVFPRQSLALDPEVEQMLEPFKAAQFSDIKAFAAAGQLSIWGDLGVLE